MATGATGVAVLGMHRSGTSAVASVLDALLETGLDPRPTASNPAGQFERDELRPALDAALADAGGSWQRPPPPGFQPGSSRRTARLMASAVRRLQDGVGPWLWKDPRLTVTERVWRPAFGVPVHVVAVVRRPEAVSASLRAREGTASAVGLALWERYQRHLALVANETPVFVVAYERLLETPEGTVRAIAQWLRGSELPAPSDAAIELAVSRVQVPLHEDAAVAGGTSARLDGLYDAFASHHGRALRVRVPDLEPEPPDVDALLRTQPGPSLVRLWRGRRHARVSIR